MLHHEVMHLFVHPISHYHATKYHLRGHSPCNINFSQIFFVVASLCSFICLQAVYQLSGPVCKATWNGCPSYSASHLHFTLCDDFLSI